MKRLSWTFAALALTAAVAFAGDSDEVLAAVSALHDAGLRRDVAALRKLYASDYFHTNPDGSVMRLDEVLKSYSEPAKMTFSSQDVADQSVLLRGGFAVATESVALHGATERGEPFVSRFRVTYVLERREPAWKFVNSHSSLLGIDKNPQAIANAVSSSAAAFSSPLWGRLEPGPYIVGFRQLERYDSSRPYRPARALDGKRRTGERARPMRISIWYPASAVPAGGKPLTFGGYVAMVAGEDRFGPLTEAEIARGERTFFQFPIFREMTPEQRDRLKAMPGRAFRDAPPAAGKFPLILYSLGSAALAHVTPEYLASRGYVVAQMPRLGAFSGLPPDGFDARDLESKIRDMDFLLASLHDFSPADHENIGVVGFSAGGRWGLSEVMKPDVIHAMVSLDSVMLFQDATGETWRKLPHFNLDLVRAPVLHMIRREWVPREDREMWKRMRYSDRISMVFEDPGLDHLDFQSAGYATTLVGMRPKAAGVVAATFEAFHRYTLAFFDAHLKRDPKAKAYLAQTPARNGVAAGLVTADAAPALPAPVTDLELMAEIGEGGLDSAIAAFRRAWKERGEPPIAEADLNLAGYFLLFGPAGPADAARLFEVNIEAHPDSPNAYDSAADAYLAAGNRIKALDYSRRALALLDRDRSLPEERRKLVRKSIEEKIARLTGPGS